MTEGLPLVLRSLRPMEVHPPVGVIPFTFPLGLHFFRYSRRCHHTEQPLLAMIKPILALLVVVAVRGSSMRTALTADGAWKSEIALPGRRLSQQSFRRIEGLEEHEFYGESSDGALHLVRRIGDDGSIHVRGTLKRDGFHLPVRVDTDGVLQVRERALFRSESSVGLREHPQWPLQNVRPILSASNHTRHLQAETPELGIMILWTRQAECANSGLSETCTLTTQTTEAMRTLVDLTVSQTNLAFSLSSINAKLTLVHAALEPDYVETKALAALTHMSSVRDTFFRDLPARREQYGADLVSLLVVDPTTCGNSYYGFPTQVPESMLSVVAWDCAADYFSLAHEVGHNLGCFHDRADGDQCGSNDSNFGYRNPTGDFRDIMATNCQPSQCDDNPSFGCERVLRFSNVGSYIEAGVVYGAIGNEQNNCAAQINRVASTVAGYYEARTPSPTARPTPTPAPVPVAAPVAVPVATVELTDESPTPSPVFVFTALTNEDTPRSASARISWTPWFLPLLVALPIALL